MNIDFLISDSRTIIFLLFCFYDIRCSYSGVVMMRTSNNDINSDLVLPHCQVLKSYYRSRHFVGAITKVSVFLDIDLHEQLQFIRHQQSEPRIYLFIFCFELLRGAALQHDCKTVIGRAIARITWLLNTNGSNMAMKLASGARHGFYMQHGGKLLQMEPYHCFYMLTKAVWLLNQYKLLQTLPVHGF